MTRARASFTREELESSTTVLSFEDRTVKFQDVDAAGTIYFPKVLEYFADNYLTLLTRAGLDVPRMLRTREGAAPLAHAEASFFQPLFFGDAVRVEIRCVKVGSSSVSFGHRLAKGDQTAAIGTTVHVFVDAQFQKANVPERLAAHLRALQAQ